MKKRFVAAGLAGGLLVGGAVGAAFGVPGISGAQDGSTTAPSTQAPTAADGSFHSNEDPAHEAAETPEQEAAEDNGTFHGGHHGHGGPGHSNEDPAHEAAESPEREAQEDAGQRSTPVAPSTAPAQTSNSNTAALGSRPASY